MNASWTPANPDPVVTMRPGGRLEGVVTIAATTEGWFEVEAAWQAGGRRHRALRSIDGIFTARTLASEWAGTLAEGRAPEAA